MVTQITLLFWDLLLGRFPTAFYQSAENISIDQGLLRQKANQIEENTVVPTKKPGVLPGFSFARSRKPGIPLHALTPFLG
jgi:hypothetical protein